MKWEVLVKILLCIALQACIIALLWVTDDPRTLGALISATSSLAWITTLWSVYEDLKKPIQTQQVTKQ